MKGLTLLETVLSVAILSILAVGVTSAISRLQGKNDLDIAAISGVEALRMAEELSRAVDRDSNWGVQMASSAITLFKGASFASRDSAFDEVIEISSDISISGASEYVFTRRNATTTPGTSTLTHILINESREVVVNSKGTINY